MAVRFDPTINAGHLLSAGVFLASALGAYFSLAAQVAQQEKESARIERQLIERIETQRQMFVIDQARDREWRDDIKRVLDRIEVKLDRKVDRPAP